MQKQVKKLNKKGISGVDISVAIVVISIGLSIIVSLFLIINKTSNKVNREIVATQIAKSILEKIKIISYKDFIDIIKDTSNENYSTKLGVDIPEGFNLEIEVEKKTPTNIAEAIQFNIRKEGNVVVKYLLLNEMVEVKLPYVKYFDNVIVKNKPNLNSIAVESPNEYLSTELFEPVEDDTNNSLVSTDNIDDWYNKYDNENNRILARRKNINNKYDIFYWEPRRIPAEDEDSLPTYLLGKTMYTLEPYVKKVEFPAEVYNDVVINVLTEKTGLPNTEDQDGKWIYIKTL